MSFPTKNKRSLNLFDPKPSIILPSACLPLDCMNLHLVAKRLFKLCGKLNSRELEIENEKRLSSALVTEGCHFTDNNAAILVNVRMDE